MFKGLQRQFRNCFQPFSRFRSKKKKKNRLWVLLRLERIIGDDKSFEILFYFYLFCLNGLLRNSELGNPGWDFSQYSLHQSYPYYILRVDVFVFLSHFPENSSTQTGRGCYQMKWHVHILPFIQTQWDTCMALTLSVPNLNTMQVI